MKKKGISPIIAFVMLMALAVTLGAFVTVWYTKSTESQTKTMIEKFGNADECADVRFDASFDYDACTGTMYNLGSFTIDKIKIDTYYLDGTEKQDISEVNIPPKGTVTAILPFSLISRLQVSPILEDKGQLTVCINEREYVPEVPEGKVCTEIIG